MIAFLIIFLIIIFAVVVLTLAATWKVFEAAGRPGWACLVPFYQGWTLAKIGGKPAWWGLFIIFNVSSRTNDSKVHYPAALVAVLAAVSLGALLLNIFICIGVAKNFGRGAGFGIVLALFPFVGYPMMAYGSKPLKYKPITQ